MSTKKFGQARTINIEITNILKVDFDSLGINLQHMSDEDIKTHIEQAWGSFIEFVEEENPFFNFIFEQIAIKSNLQKESLVIESYEIQEDTEEETGN